MREYRLAGRVAMRRVNRKRVARLREERLAEVSKRVRGESMRVNAEFAAIEGNRDATGQVGDLPHIAVAMLRGRGGRVPGRQAD